MHCFFLLLVTDVIIQLAALSPCPSFPLNVRLYITWRDKPSRPSTLEGVFSQWQKGSQSSSPSGFGSWQEPHSPPLPFLIVHTHHPCCHTELVRPSADLEATTLTSRLHPFPHDSCSKVSLVGTFRMQCSRITQDVEFWLQAGCGYTDVIGGYRGSCGQKSLWVGRSVHWERKSRSFCSTSTPRRFYQLSSKINNFLLNHGMFVLFF